MSGAEITQLVHEKLNKLFGGEGNDLLTVESPGRILDPTTYLYPVENSSSAIFKPTAVAEAESLLVDQLVPPQLITNGTTGEQLSIKYLEALNNFVPKYNVKMFRNDQEKVREWLATPLKVPRHTMDWRSHIADYNEAKTFAMQAPENVTDLVNTTLMDFHQTLLERYEFYRLRWAKDISEKREVVQHAEDDTERAELEEEYNRFIADEGISKRSFVEGCFQELVVHGFHHRVLEAFALLDIKSPGEFIEEAKANYRQSQKSLVDGAGAVLPVKLEPANWASNLNSGFTPQDLLMTPEFLQEKILKLSQEIAVLESRRGNISPLTKAEHEKLVKESKAAVKEAQFSVDEAHTELEGKYAEGFQIGIKLYLATQFPGATALDGEGKEKVKGEAGKLAGRPVTDDEIDEIFEAYKKTGSAQTKLDRANRDLGDAIANQQAAELSNNVQAGVALNDIITEKKAELDSLEQTLRLLITGSAYENKMKAGSSGRTDSNNPDETDPPEPEADPSSVHLRDNGPSMDIPGPWQYVTIDSSEELTDSSKYSRQSSSQSSWKVNLFLGSASGSSSRSSGNAGSKLDTKSTEIEIGFAAMKVNINRPGWFDPTFLSKTSGMLRLNPDPKMVLSHGPEAYSDGSNDPSQDMLPAYTTGFIIVRDVTIKMKFKEEHLDEAKSNFAKSSQASGGFLCFSAGGGSQTSNSNERFHHFQKGDTFVIKIPQPQILAWTQKYLPEDQSEVYSKDLSKGMPDGYFPEIKPPVLESTEAKDEDHTRGPETEESIP